MSHLNSSQFWKSQKKSRSFSSEKKNKSSKKSESKNKWQVVYMIISDQEGAVSIPYEVWADPIKKFIKEKGAKWCPVFKVWKTSRVQLQYIKRDLPSLLTADYQEPPSFVKLASQPLGDTLYIKGRLYKRENYEVCKNPLFEKLYPFQKQTLEFCLERHGRILIGDQMGIGKSVQSLACSLLFEQGFPLLIICPSALKHVWRDQVLKWLNFLIVKDQVFVIKKGSLKTGELLNAKVVIASYQIVAKLTSQLKDFQTVICDEAHYLKNPETARSTQLAPFLMEKKRIFLLTGTPALAKPKELFNLLKILRPDIFKILEQFGQRYCFKRQNPWSRKMQFDGAKNLAELHYILKKTAMIRRLKSEVLTQLPPKQRQIILMQTQKAVISEIKQLLNTGVSLSSVRESEKLLNLFEKNEKESEGESASIMRCYMLSAMAKLNSVKEYISSILENDIKLIIFAHHIEVMDQLEIHIKSLKFHYIRLDGSVTPETRKKKVDMFQDDSNIKVALLSITAMGTGFTLTAASTVIFAELHWTPAMLIQAEDRTHRIGQQNAVNIHYLIGDGTLDPIMLRQLERKVGTVSKVLDGESETMNIEVLPKGQMGKFQIPTEQFKSKSKKITDYFQPKSQKQKKPEEKIEEKPIGCFFQEMSDEISEDQFIKTQKIQQYDLDKLNQIQDSDEVLMLEFIRSKKKEKRQNDE